MGIVLRKRGESLSITKVLQIGTVKRKIVERPWQPNLNKLLRLSEQSEKSSPANKTLDT